MKTPLVIILLSFQIAACSSTDEISKPEEMNEVTAGKNVLIVLKSGISHDAINFLAKSDSTQFIDTESDSLQTISTADIFTIRTKNRLSGALMGFLLGPVIGGVTTFFFVDLQTPPYSEDRDVKLGLSAFAGAILGATTGVIVGVTHGYQSTYLIVDDTSGSQKGNKSVAP